jgi:hypothetical protein
MNVIEILLPLHDNKGQPFDPELYHALRCELTEMFGGVTAFNRARAALGESKDGNEIVRDRIIVIEVMVNEVDMSWWRHYREKLDGVFDQDEIVIRALPMDKI